MHTPKHTPPVARIEDVPLEVFRARTEGYIYYYPFHLDDVQENAHYSNGIKFFKEYGVDYKLFIIEGIAHIVLRISIQEVIEAINRRFNDTLDDDTDSGGA